MGCSSFSASLCPAAWSFGPSAPAEERAKFKNDLETMVASAKALTKNAPK